MKLSGGPFRLQARNRRLAPRPRTPDAANAGHAVKLSRADMMQSSLLRPAGDSEMLPHAGHGEAEPDSGGRRGERIKREYAAVDDKIRAIMAEALRLPVER